MKTTLLFSICLAALFYFSGCSIPDNVFFSYTDIKKIQNERFEAKGYFSNDPIPMLVNDPKWLIINTPMPRNAYLLLSGSMLDSIIISPDSTKYYGALVTVRGSVDKDTTFLQRRVLQVENIEVNSSSTSDRGPYIIDHQALPSPELCAGNPTPPALTDSSAASAHKFALLFSGGQNLPNAKFRYWNDLEFLYLTLRSQYGFSRDNMMVLYMDGRKETPSSLMNIGYPASRIGLENAINLLTNKMHDHSATPGIKDTLLVFVTNHGGGYDPLSTLAQSGQVDNSGDENENAPKYDEVIYYFQPAPDLTTDYFVKDDTWKSKWSNLLSVKSPILVALYEQCFSGGFLRDMVGPSRVNIAAASENAYSYSLPPDNVYDAFSYFFTAALYGRNADGTCLVPSPDVDPPFGKISILEAYKYAHSKDPGPMHKHYIDDAGDGVGVEGIPAVSLQGANQGVFSGTLFLKN